MVDLFKVIKNIANQTDEAIIMFSGGKDSIATLDLCMSYLNPKKCRIVYWYFVKGLRVKEQFFRHYEKRYGITIEQEAHPSLSEMMAKNVFMHTQKTVPIVSIGDGENYLRKKYDISYLAYGFRKNESLQRRGQISQCKGFDKVHKKIYPIGDWNHNHVLKYLNHRKLPLPVEYSYGFRDINFISGEPLIWLKQNYPDDYDRVKEVFPLIDVELMRAYEQQNTKVSN
ncbi:MAG: phosphoadenosine phosphosulfate reductase family protein [Spirochaetes bacterium]|jgi:phosphoadenosine phosphosulfate reductase|nr:phosphoadenosine phosphosulfate reductase family protein [Spirochaetota bacterium]